MNQTTQFVFGLAVIATVIWCIVRIGIKRLHKSTDPGDLVIKWIITVACFLLWIYLGVKATSADYGTAFLIPGVAAGTGIILAILWTPHIAAMLSNPFTKWYDGGDEEIELKPLYSIATAYRKRGNYDKAIAEIHKQLQRFPNDYEGWMILAETQAQDLKDLDAAMNTVNRLLTLPNLHPKNAAFALGRVADWNLDQRQDLVAAREALQRIVQLCPNTLEAQLAEQRIAHLASASDLADQHDPHLITMTRHVEKIGLMGRSVEMPPEPGSESKAAQIIQHLQDYPLDNEAREKLAQLYANEYKRLDMAALELEELITRPNQAPKLVAHWLNMMADFQMRLGGDVEAGRATLQRIIDTYPDTAIANNARIRMSQLRLELNQHSQQRTVKLGSYEKNIGLRNMNSSGHME